MSQRQPAQLKRIRARDRKRRQRARDRAKTFTKVDLHFDSPTRSLLAELALLSHRPQAHCAQLLVRQHLAAAVATWKEIRERCRENAVALGAYRKYASALSHPGASITIHGVTYTNAAVQAALQENAKLDAWMAREGLPPRTRRRLLLGGD